jgi:tRNA-splicing ligase RtcB (3'-phosphate/5'-hydroxy nucleic acid ligase)
MQIISEQGRAPIKAWIDGVELEEEARQQLRNVAGLPFIHHHVAVMPDCHWGMGATIGSVIPTVGAIVPAAVGVDLGCGMTAQQTSLRAADLPDGLARLRAGIERAIPVGGPGERGSWKESGRRGMPAAIVAAWRNMERGYRDIVAKHPKIEKGLTAEQLGTLGTGNHFIEVCLDEHAGVWVMLHSGSRGVGNRIGTYFIERAKEAMRRAQVKLPDANLAYLVERSAEFDDYVAAVGFAQDFARTNRELMMERVLGVLREQLPPFRLGTQAIDSHHNYVASERHFGKNVWVTRKGAVRARIGDLGIIPGSMGTRSYIVRGKGNPESFHSCSHGAGRRMSRGAAKRLFTVADHVRATEGVECRKDAGVIDETPGAYKDVDAVMAAQRDLVEVVHTLRAVLCVKG